MPGLTDNSYGIIDCCTNTVKGIEYATADNLINLLCRIKANSPYVGSSINTFPSLKLAELESLRKIAFYSRPEKTNLIMNGTGSTGIII
jgi:hypothetical protein